MPKKSLDSWLVTQERKKNHSIFLVEWTSIFAIAWLFWSLMFWAAPGSISPRVAATVLAGLYATCLIYGRVMHATGCKKCHSVLPFMRNEIGRRHLPDQEDCTELEYGGDEWDMHFTQVYCRVLRSDIVTYRCRNCGQGWEEKVQLPRSGYRLVRRMDIRK